MKKATILCLLLAALAAAFLTGAAAVLDGRKDDVTVTETVLSGDPSAAAGLTVHGAFTFDRRLFWNVDFAAGENGARSAFRFSHVQEEQPFSAPDSSGVLCELFGDANDDYDSLAAVLTGLENRTPPGEERNEIVRLADYYDVYPLYVYLDYPGYAQAVPYFRAPEGASADLDARMQRAFAEAFPLPVDPAVEIEAHLTKQADGTVVSHGYGSHNAAQTLGCDSAVTDEGVYFILSSDGELPVDFNGLPQGYGVYFLPMIPDENGNPAPDPDGLRNVFPLDRTEFGDIGLYARNGELLLLTYERGSYDLTVIDRATMEPRQRLSLPEADVTQYASHTALFEEDFVVLFLGSSRFALLLDDGAGGYRLAFVHALTENGHQLPLVWGGCTLADWDGERLALFSWHKDLYLVVYGADGLRYEGAFETSFSPVSDEWTASDALAVELTDLQIAWQ